MKKYLIGLALLGFTLSAPAQTTKKEQEFLRLFEAKAQLMESTLELSPEQSARFRAVYEEYERGIVDASQGQKKPKTEDPAFSKEDALAFAGKRLAVSQAILDVKKNTLPRFADILSPVQLVKFYQTEGDIRNKINREYKRRANTPAP